MRTYSEGICMVCNTHGKIKHLDRYVNGTAGLWVCISCELEIVEDIREKMEEKNMTRTEGLNPCINVGKGAEEIIHAVYIVKDRKSGLYCGKYGFCRKYWEKDITDAITFESTPAACWRFSKVRSKCLLDKNGKTIPEDLEIIKMKLVRCY